MDSNFPGGNILVDKIEDDHVYIKQDVGDTPWWFYWYFRVTGVDSPDRSLTFHFTDGDVIGTRGPAVSKDQGRTWSWLGTETVSDASFQYRLTTEDTDIRFCFSMPYVEQNLQEFFMPYADNPHLQIETLCKTKKGRTVERLHLGCLDKEPKCRVLLTGGGIFRALS